MKLLFFAILFWLATFTTEAGESFVPLQKGVRMASDDLLYNGKQLTARDAQDLSEFKNIDLSLLAPKSNAIWSKNNTELNDQEIIAINNGETFFFEGSINSNTGLYRFNVIPQNSSKIYTIHLDKTLHTLLLRKNILRKLGYIIPAIKYLKKVTIQFNSIEEREQFIKKDIPENTLGAAERWVKNVNELTLDLYDLAVTEPSENDFYNVAMGIPTQTINSRTLRSLLVPYSILDLYESVNKYSWIDGKIDNHAVVLNHFTGNDFGTTLEDAKWILRKFSLLTRQQIQDSVDQAYFPSEIGPVIVEKIISRRNSLNRLFGEKSQELDFNKNISFGKSIKDGKVIKTNYPGYAARYAFGDSETPFEQLRYYLYSKIQSFVINNLVKKFNTTIEGYDLNKARSTFFKKQFEDGLNHFIKTGELTPIGISTWTSPVLNMKLIFSRDIVLGNYLGTDNLVQLADTFGASVDVGFYVGIEGLGHNLASNAKASISLVRTFSHIKPVKSLKLSLKEPFKNMFVNVLKDSLQERYFSLSELKNSTESNEEKAKKVQALLKEIGLYLNTGESLIMTDRFMPSSEVNLNFNSGLFGMGVGVGSGFTAIKRIQIYKKSAKLLQIYDDNGFVSNLNLSFQVNEYISLLNISGNLDRGHYHLKSYTVNLSSDLTENPNLYTNALGVYGVFKNQDFEILNSVTTPVKMDSSFVDRTLGLSSLFLKIKSIKGKTYYQLNAGNEVTGNYFSLNKDFMFGTNTKSFVKQITKYYVSEYTNGEASISTEGDAGPNESFMGRSITKSIRFEASVDENKKFQNKFISLSDSRKGWALSSDQLIKMIKKINEKFDTKLFDTNQIDFKKLSLFRVSYHLNLYDRGIERLNSIKISEIEEIEHRYKNKRNCSITDKGYRTRFCGSLSQIKISIRKCQKSQAADELANCNNELVDDLFSDLEFSDFKSLFGVNNFYAYGTIDGFRKKSEILNDTIFSNTIGKIGSRSVNGPLETVRNLLGISEGEFSGRWLRDSI